MYEVCKFNEAGAPNLATLRRRDLEGRDGVLSGFASDWGTAQRILLQNFNTPMETLLFQEPWFFGGLRHSQREEGRLKIKPCSGTPSSSRTDENVYRIRDLVRSDRRWTTRITPLFIRF
ncbi:hypothetical protein NQ318_002278 [Aromia moschata]|uniref:Uncharacterized protein n=1 Tax=Aromia moschata TaxID=1265417 RepID=A0AAV8Z333_9CUCU|nr:hypothetical protein NQ318_002278 [Aromia moschata]